MFGPRPPEAQTAALRADLAACRASLRNGSKTFLAASLLLPRGVHEPASALYAFCRLADDAVDATGDRRDAVGRLRERLRLAYAGTPQDDPADRALAVVVAQHHIPAALFDGLLEGFEWDLQGRRYDTIEALHAYAARVAGTVGAMMALLMGVRSAEGLARACDLGVAMQLSNIARDVGEDARMGRLYLPRAWMREAGLDPDAWLAQPRFSPALATVVQRLLDAADALYARVDAGVAELPLACRPGINAARYLYAQIGLEVQRRGLNSVDERAVVARSRKLVWLLRALVMLGPRRARLPAPPLAATRHLVQAVAAWPLPLAAVMPPSWWHVGTRLLRTFELFEQLGRRDQQQQRGSLGTGMP